MMYPTKVETGRRKARPIYSLANIIQFFCRFISRREWRVALNSWDDVAPRYLVMLTNSPRQATRNQCRGIQRQANAWTRHSQSTHASRGSMRRNASPDSSFLPGKRAGGLPYKDPQLRMARL